MTTVLPIIVFCAVLFAALWFGGHRAAAAGDINPTVRDLRVSVRENRHVDRRAHQRRCQPDHGRIRPTAWGIPRGRVRAAERFWRRHTWRTLHTRSWCNQEARVVRAVFPSSTERAALRVAYCESRLWRWARNPSGASGVFQLMPAHWQGRFDPFNTLLNAEYAYRLSDAGKNWGPWTCKP